MNHNHRQAPSAAAFDASSTGVVADAGRQRWRTVLPLGLGALVIVGNLLWMLHNLERLLRSHEPVVQIVREREQLGAVMEQLLNAETGQRGFMLTRDPDYLKPYHQALGELVNLLAGQPPAVVAPARDKLAELEDTIALVHAGKAGEAMDRLHSDQGKLLMERVREAVASARLDQQQRLDQLGRLYDQGVRHSVLVFALSAGFNVLLLTVVAAAAWLAARRRRQSAALVREQNLALSAALSGTQVQNQAMLRLAELSQFLQTARDLSEAAQMLEHRLPQLLAAPGGAIYLMAESRNQLRLLCTWGAGQAPELCLPEDCWGLRRGRPYSQSGSIDAPVLCNHLHQLPQDGHTLCLPLATGGELLGLLSLNGLQRDEAAAINDPFITSAAETIALALGNLRLRESLRQQSLRDALTGLHNRRFLEECLQRELVRARRLLDADGSAADSGVAVLMLDVDHFKRYNDQHGHEVGDVVLREVGRQLRQLCRESDIACRYGGEEFTLVLPQISADKALERAELVCQTVRGMRLSHQGMALGTVTISVGLALYPQHGQTPQALVGAADAALYVAKRAGRDRVVQASLPGEAPAA